MSRHVAFIALGANLGDVLESFQEAIGLLAKQNVHIEKCSSAYKTPALVENPSEEQLPPYWNAVIQVSTALEPMELLTVMQSIENTLGRVRHKRWESRTMDLDLVLFDDVSMASEPLNIPHPEMHRRAFVLEPLAEIAGHVQVPGQGKSVSQLLKELARTTYDVLEVRKEWL